MLDLADTHPRVLREVMVKRGRCSLNVYGTRLYDGHRLNVYGTQLYDGHRLNVLWYMAV